jgi:hypothetical protein
MTLFSSMLAAAIPAGFAQLPTNGESEILKLAPPLPEIPPTFWEAHGTETLLTASAVVLLLIWLAVRLLRPKPPVVLPPPVLARQALTELQNRPASGAILSQVSQILRRYFATAFALPPGEMTTTEFARALAASEKVGAELATRLADFLRRCDEQKFSPAAAAPTAATATALEFIAQGEARLEKLRAAARNDSTGKLA